MVRKILAAALVTGLCLATACTSWNGQRPHEGQVKSVVLEGKNFRMLKSKLQSSAACSYLFPHNQVALLGGLVVLVPAGGIALGDPNLYEQSYRKLREQAALEGKSAQLHNVIEEVTLTDYLVIGDLKVTLTADVIEFTDEYRSYATR